MRGEFYTLCIIRDVSAIHELLFSSPLFAVLVRLSLPLRLPLRLSSRYTLRPRQCSGPLPQAFWSKKWYTNILSYNN